MQRKISRFEQFGAMGRSGTMLDVQTLMKALDERDDVATTKLVDYALSLVNMAEGKAELRRFLFEGSLIQRNFAALYFKRKGQMGLIHEAYAQGKIDQIQAYLN